MPEETTESKMRVLQQLTGLGVRWEEARRLQKSIDTNSPAYVVTLASPSVYLDLQPGAVVPVPERKEARMWVKVAAFTLVEISGFTPWIPVVAGEVVAEDAQDRPPHDARASQMVSWSSDPRRDHRAGA